MARRSRGGPGLIGIGVIAGLLTFTNAGNWLLTRLQGLSANCYSAVPNQVAAMGAQMCGGISWAVENTTEMAESVGGFFHGADGLKQRFAGSMPSGRDRESISNSLSAALGSLSGLASSGDQLTSMMRSGPQSISMSGAAVPQQFQQAIDSFTIGQNFMRSGEHSSQAQAWFQQGAQQPNGFGMFSQLSLADMYLNGQGGVPQNYTQAENYYRQAYQSLAQLRASNSPQSQQMLSSLPASVKEMQQKIAIAIRDAQQRSTLR